MPGTPGSADEAIDDVLAAAAHPANVRLKRLLAALEKAGEARRTGPESAAGIKSQQTVALDCLPLDWLPPHPPFQPT